MADGGSVVNEGCEAFGCSSGNASNDHALKLGARVVLNVGNGAMDAYAQVHSAHKLGGRGVANMGEDSMNKLDGRGSAKVGKDNTHAKTGG